MCMRSPPAQPHAGTSPASLGPTHAHESIPHLSSTLPRCPLAERALEALCVPHATRCVRRRAAGANRLGRSFATKRELCRL